MKISQDFRIEFVDVHAEQQEAIRQALSDTGPSEECIQNYVFRVVHKNGDYWIGYSEHGPGVTQHSFLGYALASTDPRKIAHGLRRLTGCWQQS